MLPNEGNNNAPYNILKPAFVYHWQYIWSLNIYLFPMSMPV